MSWSTLSKIQLEYHEDNYKKVKDHLYLMKTGTMYDIEIEHINPADARIELWDSDVEEFIKVFKKYCFEINYCTYVEQEGESGCWYEKEEVK